MSPRLSIKNADLIVADLSFCNPNVFYELGISHAFAKPLIHVTRKDEDIPFDNSHYRAVLVDTSDRYDHKRAIEEVRKHAEHTLEDDYVPNNPVTYSLGVNNELAKGDDISVILSGLYEQMREMRVEFEDIKFQYNRIEELNVKKD